MAQVDPSKQPNPIAAVLANFCCFGVLGYVMCGQTKKSIMILIVTCVLNLIGVGIIVSILGLLDVHQIATALANGEAVDENEYKFELLYKLMSIVDKSAVYRG